MKTKLLIFFASVFAISCQAQNPQPFPDGARFPNLTLNPSATQVMALGLNGLATKINISDLGATSGTAAPAQTLSLTAYDLSLTDGGVVSLSQFAQSLSLSGSVLTLSGTGGNSVTLPTGTGTAQAQIINTTVSRNLSTNDIGNTIECTSNATVSIPLNFTQMTIGQTVNLEAHNGAELIIQAPAGVTVNYVDAGIGTLSSRTQSVLFGILRKDGTNSYIISGQ